MVIFISYTSTTMKSKILNCWDFFSQYIDKDEFYSLVKKWKIKIDKEYPNPKCKDGSDWIHYRLMDKSDRNITIKKNDTFCDDHKYEVESSMSWFPSDCVSVDNKPFRIGYTNIIRYRSIYAGDIDHTEYGWSCSMVTNDKNWPRRKMLIDNWFNVVEDL